MLRALPVICFFCFVVIGCSTTKSIPSPQEAKNEILQIIETGPLLLNENFESWTENYHDEWEVWFSGQPSVRSKTPHMSVVRDYIASGATGVGFEAEIVDIDVFGDIAFVRFSAIERLQESNGQLRIVRFSSSDLLIYENEWWQIFATSIAFLPE